VALIVVDASVMIALLDPADALHQAAARALTSRAGDDLKLPASAYSESLVAPARSDALSAAKAAIASLLIDVVPITEGIAEDAAELGGRHPKLRLPDALVIATGNALNADTVLTGDAAWRRLSNMVTVLQRPEADPEGAAAGGRRSDS
jgi:predicted nucleic acid-binding protein